MSDRKESKAAARKTATISDWSIQDITLDNRQPGVVITVSLETDEDENPITKPFAFPISIGNLLFKASVPQELKQFSLENLAKEQIVFDTKFLDYCYRMVTSSLNKEFTIDRSALLNLAVFERESANDLPGNSLEEILDSRKIQQKAQHYLMIKNREKDIEKITTFTKSTEALEGELKATLAKRAQEAKKTTVARGGQIAPEAAVEDEKPPLELLSLELKIAINRASLAQHFFLSDQTLDSEYNKQALDHYSKAKELLMNILSVGQVRPISGRAQSTVHTIRVQPQFPYPEIKLTTLIELAKLETTIGNLSEAKTQYELAQRYLTQHSTQFSELQRENTAKMLATEINKLDSIIKKQQPHVEQKRGSGRFG